MKDTSVARSEFDQYADRYRTLHAENIRITGEEPAYFAEYKVVETRRVLRDTAVGKLLDFGTGIGVSTPYFRRYFPSSQLTGIDVSEESLQLARREHADAANFLHYDGRRIPADDASFDLVFTACVFHHIAPNEHGLSLTEIHRVLRPGAEFFIFEHNPLNPLTRHAVNTCPFDENAILIQSWEMRRRILAVGFSSAHVTYCTFFPSALAVLRPLEKYLGWLPLGAQYYIRAKK